MMARAPIVGSYYTKAVAREQRNHVTPLPACLRKPVQKHNNALAFGRRYVGETQTGLNLRHCMCPVILVLIM
jgi:hypothetical protein